MSAAFLQKVLGPPTRRGGMTDTQQEEANAGPADDAPAGDEESKKKEERCFQIPMVQQWHSIQNRAMAARSRSRKREQPIIESPLVP